MSVVFPPNPTLNQEFVVGNIVYTWNGSNWDSTIVPLDLDTITGATGSSGPKGDPGASDEQGSTGATGPTGPEGPVGTIILGTLPDEASLPLTGTLGEGYVVTAPTTEPPNSVFVWDGSGYSSIGPVQGPQGATGNPGAVGATGDVGPSYTVAYTKVGFVASADVNSGLLEVFTNYNTLATTPTFESGTFTYAADGVTVSETGLYQVTFNTYFRSTTQRSSPAARLSVNGVANGEIISTGYIRGQNNRLILSAVNISRRRST